MTQDLINELSRSHQKRPFWKGPRFLLASWLGIYLVVFALEIFTYEDLKLSSSLPFMIALVVGAFISWLIFTWNLNQEKPGVGRWLGLIAVILGGAFVYDYFAINLINMGRGAAVASSDVRCFNHIVLSALIPIAVFPFFIKFFFIPRVYWAISFLAVHISLLSIAVLELKCHDREFWHLILGHQSASVAIFALMSFLFFIRKKLFA